MTLRNQYKDFLELLNASSLTEDVSLHYITTLSSTHGTLAVINQFKSPDFKIKSQEFVDVVEGSMSLAAIVDTKLEFLRGGGPYLPNLDENFITDRTVNLPIIHFVSFNENAKIKQIRLSWDQGALLKLVDVIGKTGRNWPIHDGMDQIKLITSSVRSIASLGTTNSPQLHEKHNDGIARANTINATRDPHASLCLFAPRDETMQNTPPVVVASRSSAKPPQRDFKELFGDLDLESDPHERSENNTRNRAKRAVNSEAIAKYYGPSRLFNVDEASVISPEKCRDPDKFKHFDFTDGAPNEEKTSPRMPIKSKKHESQWTFDDFVTPQKIIPSKTLRANDVRHWGTSDDEVLDSPERIRKVDRPRKGIQTHFNFPTDDPQEEQHTPVIGRCRGQAHNNGLGLYRELFDEQDGSVMKASESNIPGHANVKERQKDFEVHFTFSDKSPGIPQTETISQDRAKVVKMMDSNWSSYDHSPTFKENTSVTSLPSRNNALGRPLAESTNILGNRLEARNGIKTDGDGMGGRKGTNRSWNIGDDSDNKQENKIKNSKYRAAQYSARVQTSGGDFWDF